MIVVISEKASFSLHVKVRVGCVSVQYLTEFKAKVTKGGGGFRVH